MLPVSKKRGCFTSSKWVGLEIMLKTIGTLWYKIFKYL